MRIASGWIAAAAILSIMASSPAFAVDAGHHFRRGHVQSAQEMAAEAEAPPIFAKEMSITDLPVDDNPIAAPPATTPIYPDEVIATVRAAASRTPPASVIQNPQAQSAGAMPAATSVQVAKSTAPETPSMTPAQGNETSETPAGEAEPETADAGGSALGADTSTSASNGANDVASANPPSTPELKKAIDGVSGHASPSTPPARTPGEVLFDQTHDDSSLDPLNWAVTVYKKRHDLVVYYKGRLFKKYDAVFGRNLDNAAKLYAQDRRTPEGVYTIIRKSPSRRFRWFLRLNYPNDVDRIRYGALLNDGAVPIDNDGGIAGVGGAIGIHGTDVPVLNAGHINWTTGCISVSNSSIEDLERLLPVGTVVIIER